MLHVYIPDVPTENYLTYLETLLDPSIKLSRGAETPIPADYQWLVAGRPTLDYITASPHLHGLIIPFAGLPDQTRALLANYPHIKVYNLHHNSASTAEMAVTLLLAAAKQIVPADRIFRAHNWTPRHAPMPSQMLLDKTVLILGYGRIGERVGRACQALGMQVIGIKKRPPFPTNVYPSEKLYEYLPQAHALVICLPSTEETKGMIGKREIALMPDASIIINVGRAAIVEEKALYDALKCGKLHGAGFDVWYNYPHDIPSRTHTPPAHYPFHELDTIVMSPHRAGGVGTGEIEYARMEALAALLNAAARHDPIPNEVDLTLGY
jgi:phosphoglycerate dehydrogenase-like enzyme